VFDRLRELTGRECRVASNPEFLKEGAAIDDFQKPDRVVIGVRGAADADRLRQLYAPFLRTEKPLLTMTPTSAEMTKYVANAMLSTKISFINEMANLCECTGADINDVRRGIGHDVRIGFQFLFPGVGYGGSCFPKDVRALAHLARQYGLTPSMLLAVDEVNNQQKLTLARKITGHLGEDLSGKTIALWGLAFKPATDDIREAPALVLVDQLLERGATLRVHDPEAMANVRRQYGDKLHYAETPLEALADAHALAINTEWGAYRQPDFAAMREAMAGPLIFDGRNLYEPKQMAEAGFEYYSVGRAKV
jgi:UDPglucose 6-dehydrogenase